MALEHRLTTIEVTLKQGLDDIKDQGRRAAEATYKIDDNIVKLTKHVAIQNHRIDKVEVAMEHLAGEHDKIDEILISARNTNAIVRFVKAAGGVGNTIIITMLGIFGTIAAIYTAFNR